MYLIQLSAVFRMLVINFVEKFKNLKGITAKEKNCEAIFFTLLVVFDSSIVPYKIKLLLNFVKDFDLLGSFV